MDDLTSPAAALLGPAEIRALAEELHIRPTKRLGQNFVHDANTVRRIVASAKLGADDVVLEVGPGLGSLTLALLPAAPRGARRRDRPGPGQPPARDRRAARAGLADRLHVLSMDALRLRAADLADLPAPTALVANLPYNVAVPVVLHLLAELPSLTSGLVMVQAEVADRMAAGPGSRSYGVPSVKLAWYAQARRAGSVPRAVFWPVPGVDSALVAFTRRPAPSTVAKGTVFSLVDAAFAQRRKTLRAALAGWAGSPDAAQSLLESAGVASTERGEQLSVEDFARLASAAIDAGIPAG